MELPLAAVVEAPDLGEVLGASVEVGVEVWAWVWIEVG